MRAVQFDRYGGPEVLEIREVPDPTAGAGEVVIRVVAAGINPGEAGIRSGMMHERFPAHFPSGQGADMAGFVASVGPDVTGVSVGDPVIAYSETRNAHAEFAVVPAAQTLPKPDALDWAVAGALNVAGATAWAMIEAVQPQRGETVVVAGAAGGVGVIVTQLAVLRGARVIATASEANHAALRGFGADPAAYGDGLEQAIRDLAPDGVDAFLDAYGSGNVDLALRLGVATDRIDTIIDFAAAARHGVKAEGQAALPSIRDALVQLADLVAAGSVTVPIKARFPLDQVREAYEAISSRHGLGKIVLDISQP